MKELRLANTYKVALVDDEDYEELNKYEWYIGKKSVIRTDNAKIELSRTILKTHLLVDHKDRDILNNQKNNLRKATYAQNRANSKLSKNNKSGYRGVSWHKSAGMWRATITVNQRNIELGHSLDTKELAILYNEAAKKYFGEFATLNIID